jgi:hypothetical protein
MKVAVGRKFFQNAASLEMEDFLKCECPHCGQPVEYPPAGTGQTVPCPACNRSFVLTPAPPPAPVIPTPSPISLPAPKKPVTTSEPVPTSEAGRFDLACQAFAGDPEFVKWPPTRDQIGRAWAWAKFKNSDSDAAPTHAELVAALKKLFPEFKKR